jgi:hypothetical protein
MRSPIAELLADLDYIRNLLRTLETALGQSDLLPALETLLLRR